MFSLIKFIKRKYFLDQESFLKLQDTTPLINSTIGKDSCVRK